ncbi:hypothetical protein OAN307_c19510 [Octadecabacter antarcticus 307]|uniref:Uncharacterized protein n=1 Tax=Octadecabacter antarcticus 307 TaxID=391626 RepID=M9RCQ5_9RHOB|nr:hypothetical protein [Octadecabacter antarcticus]AGI67600.1 hypothetical protein OAN307_c19510 [Octadecabacter antarcticus 307]
MILIRPDGAHEEPEDDVALVLIKTGSAELVLDQPSPPFAIIKLIEDLAGNIDRLGPSRTAPDKLNKVQEGLFKGQIKQNLVAGRTVSWRPRAKLEQELLDRLFRTNDGTKNVYAQVEEIWKHRLDAINHTEVHQPALSEEERAARGLAEVRQGRLPKAYKPNAWSRRSEFPDPGEPWQYKNVGPEWVRFQLRFRKVLEIVEDTKRSAFKQSRILVSELHNGIERLVEPERAFEALNKRSRKLEFVFSADLSLMFNDHRDKGALITNARLWMERVSEALEKEDKLARTDDMVAVAVERSGMSKTAAGKAYVGSNVRNRGAKRKSGETYISIERLRGLIP